MTPIERDKLLNAGLIWIDADGAIHDGQPDDASEAIKATERDPRVREAMRAASEAALEEGRALRALKAAERAASEAHHRARIAAVAAWSRANAAPHDDERNRRIAQHFAAKEPQNAV